MSTKWLGAAAWSAKEAHAGDRLPYARLVDPHTLLLRDGSLINHSRWEPVWKWDSFGAGPVLKQLFTGDLLERSRRRRDEQDATSRWA